MIFRTAMMLAVSSLLPAAANADEWTSPDGIVSVRVPDLQRFDERDSAPDFVRLWQSKNDYVQLCIVEDVWPSGRAIRRRPLEQAFVKDFDAQLTSCSVQRIKGNLVFVMTCRANESSQTLYAKQMLILAGGKVYKFMAMSLDRDVARIADVNAFFDSVQLLKSPAEINPVSLRGGDVPSDGPERIAGAIGEVVGLLVPFLVVGWLILRSRKAVA